MHFFGKLIPALAVTQPRAHLPPPALGNDVQFRTQTLKAVDHELFRVEPHQLTSKPFALFGNYPKGSPEPPVGSGQVGDIWQVDATLVVAQLVVGENRADVEVILLVGFDHLELQQGQISERKGQRHLLDSTLEVDPVTEVCLVDEDVQLAFVPVVPEDETAMAV